MLLKHPYYIILLLIGCSPATHIFCQPVENHFIHYTTKDGLADGEIRAIVQDSTGFLWLGCENGLSRFDGNTFKIYRYSRLDTNSLRENRVWNLFVDSKNHLWVLTFHWLYLYHPDGEWFEHFSVNRLENDVINYIAAEENGQLIIMGNRSLCKFDMREKKFSSFNHDGIPSQQFYDYKKDEDGIEWIAGIHGLLRYDPKTKENHIYTATGVGNINLLPGKSLLVNSYDQGLFLINSKTNIVKRFFPDKNDPKSVIKSLYKLNDSTFLTGTDHGLAVFNIKTGAFTHITPDKLNSASLLESDKKILSIFCDREGIIWLGSTHLEKYDFKNYNIKIYASGNNEQHVKLFENYFSIYKCKNGKFLLGSYHGIGFYDPSANQLKKIDDKRLNDKIVTNFQEDAEGKIWCNTSSFYNHNPGICVFNIKNDKIGNIQQYDIPGNARCRDMKLCSLGRAIIATSDNGLIVFDTANKTFTIFGTNSKPPSQLTNSSCTSVCEDGDGCIWVGTVKGLNKIEKDGITVKQYSQNKKKLRCCLIGM